MTRLQILMTTVLVATKENDSDTQLRQGKDGWYMTSLKTGNHFVPDDFSGKNDKRVKAHWEGFKINQNN